jgi:DNA-binding CsgD family transcriptional regulator
MMQAEFSYSIFDRHLMSSGNDHLIDQVYEAAVLPQMWPDLLGKMSSIPQAVGGVLFATDFRTTKWTASSGIATMCDTFVRDGWMERNPRPRRLAALNYAGFVHELDVFTLEELDQDPVYANFYRKHGLGWAAGTMFPMPTGDLLVFSFERKYELGPIERRAIEQLDLLRPHLARAGLLAWRLGLERARAMTQAMEQIGLPAAVLRGGGRMSAANDSFAKLIPHVVADRAERVRFSDPDADNLFSEGLAGLGVSGNRRTYGRSFPLAASAERPAMVFHLLPLCRAANDLFSHAAALLIVTPVDRAQVPTAEVLQGLFDLTPAEARVARGIGQAETVEAIAEATGVNRETVRTQLKAVLSKTGLSRQQELVSLLAGKALRSG